MKKSSPKNNSGQKKHTDGELKRYTGALTEKYHDDIKIIKEGVVSLLKSSARQEKLLNSHQERIAELMTNMTVVKTNVKELETNVTATQSDVKELRADMIEVKSDVKETKFFSVDAVKSKVDRKHFVDLDLRVRKLEKK